MAQAVCSTAICMCSMGAAPTALNVIPHGALTTQLPLANIMDDTIVNLPTFGMCMSPSNPTVAAATSAALGVLTPMPCVPAIMAPWVVGSIPVLLENIPVLNDTSKAICNWGGVVSINFPGQVQTSVP